MVRSKSQRLIFLFPESFLQDLTQTEVTVASFQVSYCPEMLSCRFIYQPAQLVAAIGVLGPLRGTVDRLNRSNSSLFL